MNPNMRGEKLRQVFNSLGFSNVSTVIASGNVVFDSTSTSPTSLETKIEEALPRILGFNSTTIVRSRSELEALAAKNPFKGVLDEKPNYLVVTFFKDRQEQLCRVLDMSLEKTPNFMAEVEKKYGKAITTRTWKTVHRILKRMNETP